MYSSDQTERNVGNSGRIAGEAAVTATAAAGAALGAAEDATSPKLEKRDARRCVAAALAAAARIDSVRLRPPRWLMTLLDLRLLRTLLFARLLRLLKGWLHVLLPEVGSCQYACPVDSSTCFVHRADDATPRAA